MITKYLLMGWFIFLISNSLEVFSSGKSLSHSAHVHGKAILNIVLDGDVLAIELHSPAFNLVGFEHAPNNAQQKAALSNAKQALLSAERLFDFVSTKCAVKNMEVEAPHLKEHKHKNHQHHQHEAHHDHADFHANYTFQCEQVRDLKTISVNLFAHFPGIQEIKAQWIFNGKQGSDSLTANNPTLKVN